MKLQRAAALTLRIERVIRARRERVFRAWTEPALIEQWSAPIGMTITQGETDLRVGGGFRAVMKKPNGEVHEVFGVYREITPPARLVYTHAWVSQDGVGSTPETIVTVDFIDEGQATRVVLTQEGFATAPAREGHVAGWNSSLDRLESMFKEKE